MGWPVNLRALIALHPTLFLSQTWYDGEPFMEIHAGVARPGFRVSEGDAPLTHAVALAQLYVQTPDDFRWRRYLWTSDTDRFGQRVYLGVNNGKMEIHRHLHLNTRWGVPTWT